MAGWIYDFANAMSGEKVIRVPGAERPRWAHRISDVADGRHTVVIDGTVPKDLLDQITTPNSTYIVQSWQDDDGSETIKYAGLVKETDLDFDNRTLAVTSYELRSLFSKRHITRVGQYDKSGRFTVVNQSVQGLVREIVVNGSFEEPGSDWNLFIVFDTYPSGALGIDRPWYEFSTIEDVLRDVERRDDGPDVEFEPRWSSPLGRLEVLLRVGNPRLQGSESFDFIITAPQPPFTKIHKIRDGTQVISHGFAVGKGSGEDIPVAQAATLDSGITIPRMQDIVKVDTTDLTELQKRAQGETDARRNPIEQWSMSAIATVFPTAARMRLGTILRLGFWNHFSEPDGWREFYLVGMAGDQTEELTLEVQLLEAT